ncbi:MAG: hypothetical protein O7A71_11315 [Chloroflexi bacterium]|nr:hypothetical protein [Chloroflexota bacterium]
MSVESTIAAIRTELASHGATIAVDGGDLVIQSTKTLPAPLLASLRRFKPILVQGLGGSTGSVNDVSDTCACGATVFYYRPLPNGDVRPLCERHSPRWVGGSALADLAGELAPRVHFSIHASDDSDSDLDHLRELFHILDLYPGANTISIRIIERDSLATYFERQAHASKALRLQLATCVRDRALARRAGQGAA